MRIIITGGLGQLVRNSEKCRAENTGKGKEFTKIDYEKYMIVNRRTVKNIEQQIEFLERAKRVGNLSRIG